MLELSLMNFCQMNEVLKNTETKFVVFQVCLEVWGSVLGHLGVILAHLGSKLGHLKAILPPTQIGAKSITCWTQFLMALGIDC